MSWQASNGPRAWLLWMDPALDTPYQNSLEQAGRLRFTALLKPSLPFACKDRSGPASHKHHKPLNTLLVRVFRKLLNHTFRFSVTAWVSLE